MLLILLFCLLFTPTLVALLQCVRCIMFASLHYPLNPPLENVGLGSAAQNNMQKNGFVIPIFILETLRVLMVLKKNY